MKAPLSITLEVCSYCGALAGPSTHGHGESEGLPPWTWQRVEYVRKDVNQSVEAVLVAADRVREAYEAMIDGRDVGILPDWQVETKPDGVTEYDLTGRMYAG